MGFIYILFKILWKPLIEVFHKENSMQLHILKILEIETLLTNKLIFIKSLYKFS